MPRDEFEISGDTKTHEETAKSGNPIRRIYYPNCGSSIYSEVAARPEEVAAQIGSVDDPSWFEPRINFWTDRALSWVSIDPDCKNFPRNP